MRGSLVNDWSQGQKDYALGIKLTHDVIFLHIIFVPFSCLRLRLMLSLELGLSKVMIHIYSEAPSGISQPTTSSGLQRRLGGPGSTRQPSPMSNNARLCSAVSPEVKEIALNDLLLAGGRKSVSLSVTSKGLFT